MVSQKSVVGLVRKATRSRSAELLFVTYKHSSCVVLSSNSLPYAFSESFDGIDPVSGKVLNQPIISGLHKYLLLYPDPRNSAEHLLFGISHLLHHPHILETHSRSPVQVPGFVGGIQDGIFATRIKDEEYNLFYAAGSPNSKIKEIHGYEIAFEKDKTEELGTFKMPLMIVGIGVALVYQVMCKGGERKKANRFAKSRNPLYNRNERMGSLTKRVDKLEKKFS